jgi:hypothetical protein
MTEVEIRGRLQYLFKQVELRNAIVRETDKRTFLEIGICCSFVNYYFSRFFASVESKHRSRCFGIMGCHD